MHKYVFGNKALSFYNLKDSLLSLYNPLFMCITMLILTLQTISKNNFYFSRKIIFSQ